jgi:hypothetical protein
MVVSVATFVGSLGVVSFLHPGIAAGSASSAPFASVASATSPSSGLSGSPLQLPSHTQQASSQPLTRTRGS